MRINGFFLLVPFLLIRFVLLAAANPAAVRRAAHFAPMRGRERIAYFIYQAANAGLFLLLFFLYIHVAPSPVFALGAACYILGLALCAVSVLHFSAPDAAGLNTGGIYRFSRNPMYLAYFVCFLGMALLTRSLLLFLLVVVFQAAAHWIILAEERWCEETFGAAYLQYKKSVRRYL